MSTAQGPDLISELVEMLRGGGDDLEPTILELTDHGDQARAILDDAKTGFLMRLHTRSDDFAATRALRVVNAASARLNANHFKSNQFDSSSAPTRDRARKAGVVPTLQPFRSFARRLLRPRLVALVAAVALVAFLWSRFEAASLLYLFFIGASLVIGIVCWTTLVWMVYAWRTPAAHDDTRLPDEVLTTYQSFSLIVPARHEEQVLEATLSRLVQTDHPDFEVLVVIGTDDDLTRAVAERVAAAHPDLVRVVLDDNWPKNKPKALNTALRHCRGDITGVFDAEDEVHPGIVRRVDQCFQRSGADVVQAGVQLTNLRSSWFAVRNALEYYFWFRSRLHFHAHAGFIPLGGNTVFIRTNVLREVGGWDPECLAEDCEIGVRLSSLGAKTVVFYEPELVTREETPSTVRAFVRQRTRWSQGFLQTLERNYWRRLPLKQRSLGLYTLAMPYLMALVWIMIPLALATALLVKVPVLVTMLAFLPAIPMLVVLAIEVAGLSEMCRSFGDRAKVRDYFWLVVGLPIYQGVLAFAASRAVVREARGVRGWEKTAHFGLHLAPADDQGKLRDRESRTLFPEEGSETLVARTSTVKDLLRGASGRGEELGLVPVVAGGMGQAPVSADSDATVRVSAPDSSTALDSPVTFRLAAPSTDNEIRAGNGESAHDASGASPRLVAYEAGRPLWMRLSPGPANGSSESEVSASEVLIPTAPGPNHRGSTDAATNGYGSFLGSFRASRAAVAVPLLLFFACVGLVQMANLSHWPATFFDEGTYVSNAWAVQRGALSNYTYGYGHPPLGWLLVSAWTLLTGTFGDTTYSVPVARQLMGVLSITSCVLLYVLSRRLGMGRFFAAAAVVLFALSPVGMYFHRLVLIDNPAITFALAAFVLALSPNRRLWSFAASGAFFAASVLSKETMLILLPALLVAAFQNSDKRTRRYCLTLLGSFLVLMVVAYPLYATLKGELLPGPGHVSLLGEAHTQLVARKATGSIFDRQSLTYGIVHFWLHLDGWLLGAAFLLSPIALARRATRAATVAFLLQCFMVLRPGYLPFMYVIGLLPFAAIVVAGTADALWRVARQRWQERGRVTIGLVSVPGAFVARVAAVVLVVVVATFTIVAAPRWVRADRDSMTVKLDGPERAAQQWLLRNLDRDERVLVSDDFWIFLIENGYDSQPVKGGFFSRTVVFYWPLDFDPAVQRLFPRGWRDFDYVVSTEGMRNDVTQVPDTARALANSRVIASFGTGAQRIAIRVIDRGAAPARAVPTDQPATAPRA